MLAATPVMAQTVSPGARYANRLEASVAARARTDFQRSSGNTRYYLQMFSASDDNNTARASHTFTTFWRAERQPDGSVQVHGDTISWLPAELNDDRTVRVLPIFPPVPGHNYSLPQTLDIAAQTGRQVGVWAPVAISPELYQRGLNRIRELNSGGIDYKADDNFPARHGGYAINCERAVTGIVGDDDRIMVWGPPGSARALQLLASSGGFLEPASLSFQTVSPGHF
ncbi:MAG: hypothetical protein ACYCW6_07255 [Candidatus Xenobia bacterium]